jgi:SAM-dependent methyltransferase
MTSNKHFPEKYIDDIAKVSVTSNYFSSVWQETLSITGSFENMLDIGCGTGAFAAEAKVMTGCRLRGVDGSDYALQQAKEIGFETLSLISDFNVDVLPFESEQFDFCLCKDLLEHLLRPDFVLREAHRVLKQGGFLLVHVPNHFTLYGRIKFLFDNDIDTYRYFPGAKRWDFPHIRFFTHESLVELLSLEGFQISRDLSHHFSAIPYGRYLIPFPGVRRKLVNRFPSQFAEGFTLLVKKA